MYIIYYNSAHTSKKAHLSITKFNWIKLFKEIIVVCIKNHTELVTGNAALLNVK
jgi:hypothetical protein